jgi:hypothetical protein
MSLHAEYIHIPAAVGAELQRLAGAGTIATETR